MLQPKRKSNCLLYPLPLATLVYQSSNEDIVKHQKFISMHY